MNDSLLADDQSVDPAKDYYIELVGEGKKFRDNQSLARGKYESDLYVKTLEQKLDQMQSDYTKLDTDYKATKKLEELIPEYISKSSNKEPIVNDRDNSITPQQIESLVSSKMQEYESSKRQQENFNLVQEKLRERYGNNYKTVLREQIEDLGLTEDYVNSLAKTSPKAFIKTLGLDQPVKTDNFQAPPRSQQRSDNFKPTAGEVRDWNWYETLRKKNPDLWKSKEMTVQRHKDYMELGERFEAGDPDLAKGRQRIF